MEWKTDWYFSGCGEFSEKLWLFLRKQASLERKHRLCTYMLKKVLWGLDSTHIWKENNWKECLGKKETPKNFFPQSSHSVSTTKAPKKALKHYDSPDPMGSDYLLHWQHNLVSWILFIWYCFFFRHTKFKNFYHGALYKVPVKSLCHQSVGSGATFMSWGLWMSYQSVKLQHLSPGCTEAFRICTIVGTWIIWGILKTMNDTN